ncbi:DUF5067 domain-containing protein [Companilactobacillus hulinensis]|uniref:DUF5067 domain-containing protein n=1 Tax=Companilactobacillus hulinensis TaxID=2486007 RepID=UPI000F77D86E|nr:DUF5067 domain-containing protein [Companilactobacillus hulinensis]
MDRRSNRNNRQSRSRVQRSNVDNSRISRDKRRKQQLPFYQKNGFIISMIIAVIVLIVAGFIIWRINSTPSNTNSKSNNIEAVKPSKKHTKKKPSTSKKTKKSEKQAEQKVKDETKNETKTDDTKKAESAASKIQNAGSYNKLTYKTDWYTFKISNDVKLVKNANGDASLLVKYTYTNNTQTPENPQKVQANAITLKQDDKVLTATSATGDYAALVNATNTQSVQPGANFDGALLVKVNNTDSDVNMYFKNIKTDAELDTMQPFKLK